MGLHLHRNENQGLGTSCYQVLRARHFPPYLTSPTVSAADPHRCSTPTRGKLCPIKHSPDAKPGGTPPFFITCVFARFAAQNLYSFQLFNFSILVTMACHHLSILVIPFDILMPAVAHHGPSYAPEALFTSILCGCCSLHRCR